MQPVMLIGFIFALSALSITAFRKSSSSRIESNASSVEANAAENTDIDQWDEEKFDSALHRFYHDVRAMDHVKYTFEKTSLERSVPQSLTKKVAYLFMVKDSVDQHQLWWKFFEGAEKGTYSIYFHQYKRDTDVAAQARESWSKLGAQYIPLVRTGWGQLSGVEYALLWEALRDPANAQFVFASEGHVPLKSAKYVHQYLMRESDNSKVCFNSPMKGLHLTRQEISRTCTYRDSLQDQKLVATVQGKQQEVKGRVRKHHQWLVLARRHAVDVIEFGQDAMEKHLRAVVRAPLTNAAKQADAAMLGASDESFVATALLMASEAAGTAETDVTKELHRLGINSECTSFVYWRHCLKKTALGAGDGWKSTTASEFKTIAAAAKQSSFKDLFDARNSPAKSLNDTPRDFGRTDALPTQVYVQNLVKAGFLFARKFGKDESGQLSRDYSEELPPLWAEFEQKLTRESGQNKITEEQLAKESAAWPVIDVGDDVAKLTAKARVPKTGKGR